jgi:hypothetical protein
MKINDVIDEINEIIVWYRSLPMDYTGINELMHQRVQMATLLTYFSTELGEYRIQWKNAEAETERVRRSTTKEYLDSGLPMGKCQEYGKYYSIEQYATEKRYDGAFNSMRFFYDTTNGVIDAMNQHISNLKREEMAQKTTQV